MRVKTIVVVAALVFLFAGHRAGLADDTAAIVKVKFASSTSKLDKLKDGAKYFTDKNDLLGSPPDELNGLFFTHRNSTRVSNVTIDAPAGSTVYVIIAAGSGGGQGRKVLESAGWTKIGNADLGSATSALSIYKQTATNALHILIPGHTGDDLAVAAAKIVMSAPDKQIAKKPGSPGGGFRLIVDDSTPIAGPTAKVVNNQTTIKCLEILQEDNGMMLGKASDLTLTLHPSKKSELTTAHFMTAIGPEMMTERDDVLRYVHVTYPNWYSDPGELTFEDKYVGHEGGSNGAAVGLLMLSAIQGFDIDDNIAVTGELAPNGKIHAIGGVSSKIHGAIDAKCTLVALPVENKDQLVDALIYSGPETFLDIQVLGISNMKNAIGTVRSDRDQHLADAITEFSALQENQKHDSRYYLSTEGKGHLEHILQLAPDHLSAQLLRDYGQNLLPKTLSAGASLYYTFLDADCMAPVLMARMGDTTKAAPPSAAIHQGLAQLRKLRPLADPTIRPLIDAFDNFILAWDDLETGHGSTETCQARQKELQDAMGKLQADQALMQKMLNEGM